jgi:hypothetical protein
VIQNPLALISEFRSVITGLGLVCGDIQHEAQPAPHRPHRLPEGKCALYVFSLSQEYGERCPAGTGRVLKVGKAGPNSNARFQSHHYELGRAPSTLAGTLVASTVLWHYLGITELGSEQVADWIRASTDRDNFYFDSKDNDVLGQYEKYVRARLGPVLEGG